jgi:hypothetical protein
MTRSKPNQPSELFHFLKEFGGLLRAGMESTMLTMHKVDRHYVILKPDQEAPMLGQSTYFRSPQSALAALGAEIDEFCGIPGAYEMRADVPIEVNKYASRDLIVEYGFRPVITA